MGNKERRVTWVVLTDKKQKDSELAVKEAMESIKALDKTALIEIEKEFRKLSAQARINLFAQMIEGLYNICNLPDYIKTGILFNSASIHNQLRPGVMVQQPGIPKESASYIG